MTNHPWNDLVLGGLDRPRFLVIDQNFCSNPFFDVNTTGWTFQTTAGAGVGSNLSRYFHSSAFSRNYLGRLELIGTLSNAYYQYNAEANLQFRTFMARFRARVGEGEASREIVCDMVSSDETLDGSETTFTVTDEMQDFFLIGTAILSGDAPEYYIRLRIFGADHVTSGVLYFDNVYFTEVFNDIVLPQPNNSSLNFNKIIYGTNKLWVGKEQEFSKRWQPVYHAFYQDHLIGGYEVYRQKLSQAENLFCMPHQDVDWGFVGIWSGDLHRQYAWDRFIAHKGEVNIKGMEYVISQPEFTSGTGVLFVDDDYNLS